MPVVARLTCLAAVGSLLLFSACERIDPTSQLEAASSALERGDAAEAVIAAKNYLQALPTSGEGRLVLGRALIAQGDFTGAQIELERAIEGQASPLRVAPWLAQTLSGRANHEEVVKRFAGVQLPDPASDAALRTLVASSFLALGDNRGAQTQVDAALTRQPEWVEALTLRVRLLAIGDHLGPALGEARALTKRFPQDALTWQLLGDLEVASGTGLASEAYERAVSLNPKLAAAHGALILSNLRAGELEAAKSKVQRMASATAGNAGWMYFDALHAHLTGDFVRARERAQALLKGGAQNPEIFLLAGLAERSLGAPSQAEVLLTKAVAGMPESVDARRELAALLVQTGQSDRALQVLRPALESARAPAPLWTVAGMAHTALGNYKAADAAFASAAKQRPDDARLRTEVGRSLLARGQVDAGIREFRLAVQSPDAGIEADVALIAALAQRGDLPGAGAAVAKLITKQPTLALPEMLRGQLLERAGDRLQARKAYEAALAKDFRFGQANLRLAELDLWEGQPQAAAERYRGLLQREPGSAMAMIGMAEATRAAGGSRREIDEWLDKAVAAQAGDASTWLASLAVLRRGSDAHALLTRAQRAATALPNDPGLLMALADAQQRHGDIRNALITLNKVLVDRPRSLELRLQLADLHLRDGNATAAKAQVREAATLDANSPAVARAWAALALRDGDTAAALDAARRLQRARPADPQGWSLEADVQTQARQWAPAKAAARKALGLGKDTQRAIALHGVLERSGTTAEVRSFEEEWLRSYPKDAAFLSHLGARADAQGDLALAEQHYRAAAALEPLAPLLLNNLADLLVRRGSKDALTFAQRAARLAPDTPPVLDTLAAALAANGQVKDAVDMATRAVSYAPDSPALRLSLAKLQLQAGDRLAARAELQRLIEKGAETPARAEARRLLGTISN